MKRSEVTIIYKSGAMVKVTCKSLSIELKDGRLSRATWDDMKPSPLLLGIDEIAAIFEGKV